MRRDRSNNYAFKLNSNWCYFQGLDELTSYVDAAANVHDSKNEKDASDEKGCKEEKRRSLSKRNEGKDSKNSVSDIGSI